MKLRDLPPSLIYADIPYTPVSADICAQLRGQFNRETKGAFLIYLTQMHDKALEAMGITDDAYEAMRLGNLPKGRNGEYLDCSIDHILSLRFGGTNHYTNLMLLPLRYNAYKEQIESEQIKNLGQNTTIKTIIAAENTPVPFIEGGFKRNSQLANVL